MDEIKDNSVLEGNSVSENNPTRRKESAWRKDPVLKNNPTLCGIIENATFIHSTDDACEVYMISEKDIVKNHWRYGFVVISDKGEISKIEYVSRQKLITSHNPIDFFFNYLVSFTHADISAIIDGAKKHMDTDKGTIIDTGVPLKDVHNALCKYCAENSVATKIEVSDDYCDIETSEFENVLKAIECGYPKLEVLKVLRAAKALMINKNRPFDWKKTNEDKKQYNVYRIINLYKGVKINDN